MKMFKTTVPKLLRISSCASSLNTTLSTNKFLINTSVHLRKQGYVTLKSATKIPDSKSLQSSIKFYSSDVETPKMYDKNEDLLIYRGKFTTRIRLANIFTLSTSIMGLFAQPVLFQQGMNIGGTAMAVFLCTTAGFFTFVTPFLLHIITKKYATEVTYNPKTDEYTATVITFFIGRKKITFKIDDITVPESESMFSFIQVTPKKIPLFVAPQDFADICHYKRFMGYDKPIDFKLDPIDNKELDIKDKMQK